MAIPISGGPFDGGKATALGGRLRYLGPGADATFVAHRQAAPGRVPYIRESDQWRYPPQPFVQEFRKCRNCGADVIRTALADALGCCPLCGDTEP